MKTILLALALAALSYADAITFATSDTATTDPSGRHLELSGDLSIPQFDSNLGALTGISYQLGVSGFLNWQVLQAPIGGYAEYAVNTQVDFLGVSDLHKGYGISGSTGGVSCSPGFPPVCRPTATSVRLAQLGIEMDGAVGQNESTISNPLWYEMMATTTLTGLPQAQLQSFSSQSTLPYSLTIDALGATIYPAGFVLGDLAGTQSARVWLNWQYIYDPAQFTTQSIAATEAPEPNALWILFAMLCLMASWNHIRALKPARRSLIE